MSATSRSSGARSTGCGRPRARGIPERFQYRGPTGPVERSRREDGTGAPAHAGPGRPRPGHDPGRAVDSRDAFERVTFADALREVLDDLGVEAVRPSVRQPLPALSPAGAVEPEDQPDGHQRSGRSRAATLRRVRLPAPGTCPRQPRSSMSGPGPASPACRSRRLRPLATVTLVESTLKKVAFLCEATRGMPNVRVRDCRIGEWEGTAEWALLRAVNPARVLGDVVGRATRVAMLGTERPPDGPFTDWESRPTPWSRQRRLWLGAAR